MDVGTVSSTSTDTISSSSSIPTATTVDGHIMSPSMQLATPFGYRMQMLGSAQYPVRPEKAGYTLLASEDIQIAGSRLPSLHSQSLRHCEALSNGDEPVHSRINNTSQSTTNKITTNFAPDNIRTVNETEGLLIDAHPNKYRQKESYYHPFVENGRNNCSSLAIQQDTTSTNSHIDGGANDSLTSYPDAISPVPNGFVGLGNNTHNVSLHPLPLLPQPPSDDGSAKQREGYSRQWFAAQLTPETYMDTTHSSLSSQNIKKQILTNSALSLGDLNQQRSSRRQANTRVVLLEDQGPTSIGNDKAHKRHTKLRTFVVDGNGSDLCASVSPPPALTSASPIVTRCSSIASTTRRSQAHEGGGYRSPSYFRTGSMNSLHNAENYTVMMLDFSAPVLVHSASSNGGVTRVESNLYSKIETYESIGRLSPSLSSASGWVRDNHRHPNQPDEGSSVATDGVVPILAGTITSGIMHIHGPASDDGDNEHDFSLASEGLSAVLNFSP